MNYSIVITSYNGRHLLEKHLPSVIKNSPKADQIFVYDDASEDDTPQWIKTKYPQIIFQRNPKNLGFTKNTNLAVANTRSDFVVLLNNDVSPKNDYIQNSSKHFKDPKIFAVTFAEDQHSWPKVIWDKGKLQFTNGEDRTKSRYCAWPSGGSCIFKKSIWEKLGGYNEIYSPGYFEDIDLGWRAWKQGYKIIWDPGVLVDHQHESTFKKLNPSYISLIKQRNELLFTWQNITDRNLAASHYRFLISHTLKHPGYAKVILAAMRFYPRVVRDRIKNRQLLKFTDHEVLTRINQQI